MRYTVVDSTEFTYPDIFEYATSSDRIELMALRGGYAAVQLLFAELEGTALDLGLELDGGLEYSLELYTLRSVMVESNRGMEENPEPHFPERIAPYRLYDCLRTFDGTVDNEGGVGGVYLALKVSADAEAGVYHGRVRANGVEIPVTLEVFAAKLPEETLKIIMGYRESAITAFHGIAAGTPEYDEMNDRYYAMLRRMHQNMMYTHGVSVKELGDNKYEFDFSGLEKNIRLGLKNGMKYFNGPSIGWRKSWSESTILLNGKLPAMSYEGYCYLTQYLPALHEMLERNGWLDIFVMGVADEPNAANCTEFRALCGLVHKIVPDIKLIDAMSYGDLHGALDIWVPLNAEYDKHRAELETLRTNGSEIWHYVCCGPRGEHYINRFMDYPLLATRYLYWGNYKYNLTGYLHWAANCYQPGQDPFEQNCPEHHNTDSVCILPAGDTHIIYPGDDGPWMSIRLENQRDSAEEYELFRLLAAKNRALADEICDSCFRSFCDVEYDPIAFRAAKRRLYEAVSA